MDSALYGLILTELCLVQITVIPVEKGGEMNSRDSPVTISLAHVLYGGLLTHAWLAGPENRSLAPLTPRYDVCTLDLQTPTYRLHWVSIHLYRILGVYRQSSGYPSDRRVL